MAEEPPSETLDSPPSDRSADQSPTSVSSHSSTADPSLSRSVSFSRLNAKAPEFVPTRPIPARADLQQQPRLVIPQGPPPPPPSGVVHMFPTSPFHHVPIQSHVPAQNHHQHHHHRVQYHPHHQQHQYYGSGFGEQEAMHAQQAAGEPADHAAASRNGLPEEATQKILNQVEYYFSDVNLATTDHLMRFINKDPEGYVPISVVASFKKIKALISSQSQLATILRNSTKLVVSEDGKKVKRRHPLTELDMEELQSRIVIAENLPEDHCHQNLMKVFSAVGSVKTIRTIPHPLLSLSSHGAKTMAMLENIVGVVLLMLLLILLLILLACKPWRFFFSSSRSRTIKVEDIERPFIPEDANLIRNQSNEVDRNYVVGGPCIQTEGHFSSPRTHGLVHKQRVASAAPHLSQGGSLVLDVVSDSSEDVLLGQTLKCPLITNRSAEEQKHGRKEDLSYDSKFGLKNDRFEDFVPKDIVDQGCSLTLEVISGPSRGLRCTIQSTNSSRLPLTLGRVSPSDLLLKDSEVSGKHAMINWNLNKLKWELVDMGSLNGTLLNSHPINHPDSGSRTWGDPIELASGDIITLGTTSKVHVLLTPQTECQIPFGIGVASDPMALRRGGKKFPMEDVCYYQWPLPGVEQFGLLGICDGHGGAAAAKSASKILPEKVANILSDPVKRERVLSLCDASDVLRDAFFQTEACMDHNYEGCTATALLVWADGRGNFFAQCANVGDSACVFNIAGKQIKMTEDHRITSSSERHRINETGEPLKDGDTRLCGLNLARMLGDKFLKQQEGRFSSEPYISQVVHIDQTSGAFALLASDGLWDVISVKKAVQLALQARERCGNDGENTAEKIANYLLSEARTLRTKDNTSIIFLDFDDLLVKLIHEMSIKV